MPSVCILSSVHIALDNRVFFREALSLRRAGYEVTLIAIHDRDEVKDGVRIVALPRIPRWQRPRLWVSLLQRAWETQADIYHFHDPELTLVTPWLRLRTGKPTVYDVHEVNADFIRVKDYMPGWLRQPIAWAFGWLEPLLARLQSGLIFADDQIALPFRNVDRPKITLFNFPSMKFVEDAAAATATSARKDPVVLYLGGLERNRGSRLMMEAFHQVSRQMPEAKLLLVGHFMPPDLQEELLRDARQRGIEAAVTVTGRVPFEQIGDYLQQAAVGWVTWQPVPKNEKNIPTKLFEYMAYGVPVVSSDLPSTRQFVHDGKNGYLVTADDPTAHAQAILRILRDPQAGLVMGRQGQSLVQTHYNWEKMESRLLAFYQNLLS
ncbi:MAG: glycosyltransferase family 4 protein [Chloroflexota bacterium]|nr:glycosyltransferase family 4 protein [Chloroflexota bacterium]